MNVTGVFSFIYNKSGEKYEFTTEDADFECIDGSERQMGPENHYEWATEIVDEKSGENIEIEYGVWEYPVGMFNYKEVNIEGATIVSEFSFDFVEEPDINDYELDEHEDNIDIDLDLDNPKEK